MTKPLCACGKVGKLNKYKAKYYCTKHSLQHRRIFLHRLLYKHSLMVVYPEKFLSETWEPIQWHRPSFFFLPPSRFLYSELGLKSVWGREKHVSEYSSPFTFIVAIEGAKDELECYLAICEVSVSLWSSIRILEKYVFHRFSCQFRFSYLPFYVLMLEIRWKNLSYMNNTLFSCNSSIRGL